MHDENTHRSHFLGCERWRRQIRRWGLYKAGGRRLGTIRQGLPSPMLFCETQHTSPTSISFASSKVRLSRYKHVCGLLIYGPSLPVPLLISNFLRRHLSSLSPDCDNNPPTNTPGDCSPPHCDTLPRVMPSTAPAASRPRPMPHKSHSLPVAPNKRQAQPTPRRSSSSRSPPAKSKSPSPTRRGTQSSSHSRGAGSRQNSHSTHRKFPLSMLVN